MTSFVYDFKDIASRMKGELKAQPEPIEVKASPLPQAHWRYIPKVECTLCNGDGENEVGNLCPRCHGLGVEP